MRDFEIPKTPGSYNENINSEIGEISFAFEPDPEYGATAASADDEAANSYNICVKGERFKGGDMFFSSLSEIEEFANELNAFVKRHRQ